MMKFIRKYRRDQSIIVASLLFIQLQYISLNCNIFSNVLAANVESTTTTAGATDFLAATWDTMSLTIEELWLRETKNAEEEIERQMLGLTDGNSMSMVIPTPAPAAAPSPIATTLVPVDDTPTIGPTPENCLNGRTSEQYLLDTLAAITTSLDVLLNPATPQGQAFNFLLNDTLIDDDDAICNYTTLQQRYGLATFYYATEGLSWENNTNWVQSSIPECIWYGVYCNQNNQVTNLTLPANNVVGALPNELSTLYMLDRLELFSNNVSGTFPDGLQNVSQLQVLDIEFNQISGMAFNPIILSLSNLRQLFISSNLLTGTMPPNIFDTVYPFLTDLWIANNEIMGPLPTTFGSMPKLRTFIAYGNQLDGEIPPSIGNVTDLTNLQLYRNMFDQTIPTQVYGLTQLSVLRLDQNFLTGTIDANIGQLNQLTDLRVSNNFIEGTIPETVQLLQNLTYLVISNNLFSGSVPDVFTGFDSLQDFDVSAAFFTGPIPSTLFTNIAIQNVYVSNNAFTGTIPSNYSNPLSLLDLYLDNNLLNGTIPSIATGDFLLLNELLLQNNEFTGSVPPSICTLRNISLENLFTDCGGATPEITCTFPTCCNRCFAGGQVTDQRRTRREGQQRVLTITGDQHE